MTYLSGSSGYLNLKKMRLQPPAYLHSTLVCYVVVHVHGVLGGRARDRRGTGGERRRAGRGRYHQQARMPHPMRRTTAQSGRRRGWRVACWRKRFESVSQWPPLFSPLAKDAWWASSSSSQRASAHTSASSSSLVTLAAGGWRLIAIAYLSRSFASRLTMGMGACHTQHACLRAVRAA